MKQPGIFLLYVIVLMSIICSAAATTTPEPEEDCLEFTKISYNEITLSWDRSCFSNDTSYTIELHGDISCTKNVDCNTDHCKIEIKDMGCFSPPIKACSPATYIVTGNSNNDKMNRTTTAAPRYKSTDWKLKCKLVSGKLSATWGPPEPEDSTSVSCAKKANVSATCDGQDGELGSSKVVDGLIPANEGTVELPIGECNTKNATLTVTYMSEGVPTKTKNSTTLQCSTGARNVYPHNVVISSGIAMIFGILLFNY